MSQMDRRAFLAAAGATAAVPSVACAQEPAGGWTPKAPLPWAIQEVYCAVWRGAIVLAGGLARGEGGQLLIEGRTGFYVPHRDRWLDGPALPAPRHHPMLITSGDTVHVLGGYGRSPAGDWTAMTDV